MALDEETKKSLIGLQNEAEDILADITEIFPDAYCFTLVARHMTNHDLDIVLTNDVMDDSIGALQRNKDRMEQSS